MTREFMIIDDQSSAQSASPDDKTASEAAAARILTKLIALGVDKVFDLLGEDGKTTPNKNIENHMRAWGHMVTTLEAQEMDATSLNNVNVSELYETRGQANAAEENGGLELREAFNPEIMVLNEAKPTSP